MSYLYFALLKQRSFPNFVFIFCNLLTACRDVMCDKILDLEGSRQHWAPGAPKFIHSATTMGGVNKCCDLFIRLSFPLSAPLQKHSQGGCIIDMCPSVRYAWRNRWRHHTTRRDWLQQQDIMLITLQVCASFLRTFASFCDILSFYFTRGGADGLAASWYQVVAFQGEGLCTRVCHNPSSVVISS